MRKVITIKSKKEFDYVMQGVKAKYVEIKHKKNGVEFHSNFGSAWYISYRGYYKLYDYYEHGPDSVEWKVSKKIKQ